jgi:hypothetical protein
VTVTASELKPPAAEPPGSVRPKVHHCSLRARGMPNKGKKKASSDSSGEVSLH